MSKVSFKAARNDRELEQILDLQQRNLEGTKHQQRNADDGFVTVRHDLSLLRAMNQQSPHIIATADACVVAYALIMRRRIAPRIPILAPLFERLESLSYRNRNLADQQYFVMGQICVAKAFRGQGICSGLYRTMAAKYSDSFDCVVTEIASRNGRSLTAHRKVGFRTLDHYTDETDTWDIVIWGWN